MPFLLPRTVGSTQVEPTVFEGNASLLIAWAVIPKEKAQADLQVNGGFVYPSIYLSS